MCSAKEVQDIVDKSERHLKQEMQDLETRQNEQLEKSHMAISKSISSFGSDLKQLSELVTNNYSKREIDSNNENMKTQLDRIEKMILDESKLTAINKTDFAKLETKINTAILVLGVTLPTIIGISTWIFFNELNNMQKTIEDTLPERVLPILEQYEFQVTSDKYNE